MPGALHIPKYTGKGLPVLIASMLPVSMLMNYFLFGATYFNENRIFLWGTLVTFLYLSLVYFMYGFVAFSLRNRFPADNETFKRLMICITIFFLMSAVYISILLLAYDNVRFLGYEYDDADLVKCYVAFIIINVFLTFLNEGVYRFEKYRATVIENEQLNREYIQSQLLGLKSQMNPHFLFNSLNTLSSLIQEDAGIAEDFLDHMSKVYRYLLRNNEEQLVTVETELNFIKSYYYLLKARHGDGLNLTIDVPEAHRGRMLPPLTVQMIVENAMNGNTIGRGSPLRISIKMDVDRLEVRNNVQPKINGSEEDREVLDNISSKFKLLCQQDIVIRDAGGERTVQLPLIIPKENFAA